MEMAHTSGIILLPLLLKGDTVEMAFRYSTVYFCFGSRSQMGVGSTFKYSIVCCSSKGGW